MSSEESGEESGSEDGGSRVRILKKRKLTFRSDKVDEFFARLDTLIKDDKRSSASHSRLLIPRRSAGLSLCSTR